MLVRHFFAAFACVVLGVTVQVSAQKVGVKEILEGHRASLGEESARSQIKNVILVGDATVRFVTGKTPEAKGRIVVATEGGKSFIGMNFNAPDYPREAIVYDGKDLRVGAPVNNSRSVLGNFLMTNDRIVSESLLGGTLLQSWGPLNPDESKAKIGLDGTKKIDGREAYVVSYTMKGGSELKVKLFIDKETFRHVRTEYSMIFSASIGRTPNESARFSETRLKVTEDFGNFQTEAGLTLPRSHKINYSAIGQNGTTEIEWQFTYTEIGFNQPLSEDTFGG